MPENKTRRVTRRPSQTLSVLKQEIAWCLAHPGVSGHGLDFERGFIAGLRQAIRLAKVAERK